MTSIEMWPHYKVINALDMERIRSIFPDGKANAMNWFVASTSGVHGSYATIDEIETDRNRSLTCLIIQPRLVVLHYGEVSVTKKDLPFLRGLVSSTLKAIAESQKGNT